MIAISHPTGNENVRNAALAIHESEMLAAMWTCVGWSDSGLENKMLPECYRANLHRRVLPVELRPLARYVPFLEIMRLGLGRLLSRARTSTTFSIDNVYCNLDRIVAREVQANRSLRAVYCYEDGASDTFRCARGRGIKTLYELPMGYWRSWHSVLKEEIQLQPEWASTLQGTDDSPEKLARKDSEYSTADHIFVASNFARSTLPASYGSEPVVHFVPYGSSSATKQRLSEEPSDVLRILFVGALTQRKGLSYLFDAVKMLGKHVKLTLIGRRTVDGCLALNRALAKHHWIESVPHERVLELMRVHDVLVFPSLFEGYGLVISEALSQGLPVITTTNTAGPDILDEGSNGFIVPIRSSEAIAEKLERLLYKPRLIEDMKQSALKAVARFSWHDYRYRLMTELRMCCL